MTVTWPAGALIVAVEAPLPEAPLPEAPLPEAPLLAAPVALPFPPGPGVPTKRVGLGVNVPFAAMIATEWFNIVAPPVGAEALAVVL